MEIERKFLVKELPSNLNTYPFHLIEQAYLCTAPVVRIRRQDQEYILTYKSSGMMSHEEYNLPLNEAAYEHLKSKADGNIITKKRYVIPFDGNLKIELDLFFGVFDGLVLAEVEFPTEEDAIAFCPPAWFGADVTFQKEYHNSFLSQKQF